VHVAAGTYPPVALGRVQGEATRPIAFVARACIKSGNVFHDAVASGRALRAAIVATLAVVGTSRYRMFMPKMPLSVTLDEANLLWLKGRAAGRKKRSLSEALDEILTAARRGGRGADAPRSVVGTVDLAHDDPALDRADTLIRAMFEESAARPVLVRERPPAPAKPAMGGGARKARRG
jgi:hypothetical protein